MRYREYFDFLAARRDFYIIKADSKILKIIMEEDKICQSCGMPLVEESDKGTNDDGSKSEQYCHYCFQDGKFTDEGISLEEKIENNVKIAQELGMEEEDARQIAKDIIPTLSRWKK